MRTVELGRGGGWHALQLWNRFAHAFVLALLWRLQCSLVRLELASHVLCQGRGRGKGSISDSCVYVWCFIWLAGWWAGRVLVIVAVAVVVVFVFSEAREDASDHANVHGKWSVPNLPTQLKGSSDSQPAPLRRHEQWAWCQRAEYHYS